MKRLAILLSSLLLEGAALATTVASYSPCSFNQTWLYLDCASRRDAGRGRFLALQDEIRVLCRSGDKETQITVRNWLEANCDQYSPDVAEALIGTFHRFRSAAFPGDFMDYQLGRQAFRRLPREEQMPLYREALRDGQVDFDSGYVLWASDALRDAGDLGLTGLAVAVRNWTGGSALDRDIALWKLCFRAGATSRSDALARHLRGLEALPFQAVADGLLHDLAFSFSIGQLRDDLCDPVRTSECGPMKALLTKWRIQIEADPELASTHLTFDTYQRDRTLAVLVKEMGDAIPSEEHCCRPAE
jgi:hypothetical protein